MQQTMSFLTRITLATVALLLAGACDDERLPTAPDTPEFGALPEIINCRATVSARSLTCESPKGGGTSSLSLSVTLGGQGEFVQLASSDVSYDGSLVFQADVTVQNLIGQMLGTTDGTGLDLEGVRVFFHSGPTVTSGTGAVTVANATGTATFTGGEQPYFQYDEMLDTDDISSPMTWQWNVPGTVITFEFEVYVTAAVQYPQGWVDVTPAEGTIQPGGTLQLSAEVRDQVGRILSSSVTWSTSDEDVANVSTTGVVTAVAVGTATITATSNGVDGTAQVTVATPSPLYLRYVSPNDFLSNQPATSGATVITLYNYGSGQSTEFQAVLGNAITGTDYGFSLWFGAGTSSGQTGTWTADILVEDGGVETTLATYTFSVPYNTIFVEYTANVTGIAGGTAGDIIILRLTLTDVSRGAVLFGAAPYDSHVLVPGTVTVSPAPSPPAASAEEESGVKVEVTAGQSVRYPGW